MLFWVLFFNLLDESLLRSRSYFGRLATPGKVHHCSKCSPFVDNGSLTVVRWCPNALEMVYPFPDWYMSTILFLICSWISLDRGMMCCSLSMLYFFRQLLFKNLFNCHCPTGGLTCHWCARVHLKNLHHNRSPDLCHKISSLLPFSLSHFRNHEKLYINWKLKI